MLQLSVCIEMIFADMEFAARIDAVAKAGLPAFEIWGWRDKDLQAILTRKERHGLELVNMNLDPPLSLLAGDTIHPFLEKVRESCAVARQLGCGRVTAHVQEVPLGAGEPWYSYLADVKRSALRRTQRSNIVQALRAAGPIAQAEGVMLLLEPLNTLVDHDGYFISASHEGFEILREVASPAVGLLFDVYHQQITEGNLINNLTGNIGLVKHIHCADVPGRHQPGTGEVNFQNVLLAAKRAGYDGYVGLEYTPRGDSYESLARIREIVEEVNRTVSERELVLPCSDGCGDLARNPLGGSAP